MLIPERAFLSFYFKAQLYCQNRRLKCWSDVIVHSYLSLSDHQIWFSTCLFYRRNNLAWTYIDHSNPKHQPHYLLFSAFYKNNLSNLQAVDSDQIKVERGWLTTNTPDADSAHFLPPPPPRKNQAFIKRFLIRCSQICFFAFCSISTLYFACMSTFLKMFNSERNTKHT